MNAPTVLTVFFDGCASFCEEYLADRPLSISDYWSDANQNH